jgi:hypothetical protein
VVGDESALASIVPVRAELAGGDHRLLYLAWLLCVHNDELDEDAVEPPVPPGLGKLSAPLRRLADFLRLDGDLIAAAAESSAALVPLTSSPAALEAWVKQLPEVDKDRVIMRLLTGDSAHLRAELLRRYGGATTVAAINGGRTVNELQAGAAKRCANRNRIAEEQAAAELARREAAEAAAREQRLDQLAIDPERAWQRVAELIATRKPKDYDAAVALLVDLKALSERDNLRKVFRGRIHELRQEHARKPSLLDRMANAGLG